MRIAVIGAGHVGQALGKSWAKHGHDVTYGVRNPADAKYAALNREGLNTASVADAARAADAILLATPWPATEAAIAAAGDLAGKLLLDATNPLTMGPAGIGLAIGHSTSAGEMVAAWAKGASVFKTLNTTGYNNMENSGGYPLKPVMFFAGDDAGKKPTVAALLADLGYDPVDAGPLSNARLLEPYAMLWIDLALKRGQGRDIAFALMRRG